MTLPRILETEWMDSPDEAEAYDTMDHREVNERFVQDLLSWAEPFRSSVRAGAAAEPTECGETSGWIDVLDLGTGTALIPVELCRQTDNCRVMAADAAQAMLELARYRVEAAGVRERIQLSLADAKQLPFTSGQFHVVMSNSLVHHVPEPLDVLREAVRVTADGGWLFVRDLCRPEDESQLARLVDTYAAAEPELARQLFADSLRAALTVDEMRDLVQSLGLPGEDVRATSDRHWTWTARVPWEREERGT